MAVGRLVLAALLAVMASAHAAWALRPETLDLPATITAAAQTAAMSAVTVAGARLVAVGERGIVLLSDDAGATWRQARSVPVSATLTAVRFADAQSGWCVGHAGVVLHTADGGETWALQLEGAAAAAIMLADAEHLPPGEAREGLLVQARQFVADGADKPFLDLSIDNADILAVGAFGLAVHSSDAGRTWHSALDRFDGTAGLHLYHLARIGDDEMIAGEQGSLLVAHESGPFERSSIPYGGTLFGVLALPDRGVLAYGLHGTLLLSAGLGQPWALIPTGLSDGVASGLVLADGRVVLAGTGGEVLVSRDGGRSVTRWPGHWRGPATSLAELDGQLVVVGPRGPWHLAISEL